MQMMHNTGQTCTAPSRMLVPASKLAEVESIAAEVCKTVLVGDPMVETTAVGPLASGAQYEKVNALIQVGIDEGAAVISGGLGSPEGLEQGYFVKPTVFSRVNNQMTIAREEILARC
jgi:aldehyde dehydrogenase (NAD+)/betaine-aldehyde dehydrogenase